jgi:translocation and assembly module TamA
MTPQRAATMRASWFGAALTALAACGTAKPKPDAPEVKSLDIEGTQQVSAGELKSKILTSASSWWPWAERQYFDPTAWEGDLHRIVRVYQAEGYYSARVVDEQVIPLPPEGTPDKVELKVRVEEGPPTHISKLAFGGLDALAPEQRLEALYELPIKEGAIFKEKAWQDVKAQIQSRLRQLGYAEASVRGLAEVDVAKNEADLQIVSDVGQRYRFGDLSVSTNPDPRTPINWIREQAERAVKKGTWFSESALNDAQARVQKMGVFGAVKVNPGPPDRVEGTVPVVVDVREAPFHTLRLGGGIQIDQARNEVRLISEYTDRDFLGGLRRLTLKGKLGWVFVPNIFAVLQQSQAVVLKSEPIYLASAEFEQPRWLFRDVRLQAGLQSQRDVQQTYSSIGGSGRLGFAWQPHPSFSISPSYNLEVDYLLSGQTTLGGQAPALLYGCEAGEVNCVIVLSYLEQAIVWDRRDDFVNPRKGFYLALTLQEGGGPLGGNFSYLKVTPEARYYYSFPRSEQFTVAARVRLGILKPLEGTSPIVVRYFSGGDFMRGFNYRRLSPLVIVPDNPTQTLEDGVVAPAGLQGATVPIGGNGLFESSLETRYNFTGTNFVLAAFLDAGFVTSDDLLLGISKQGAIYFARNMQYAVGIGVRYHTPIGPVRFDIARRLNIGPPLPVSQQDSNHPLNPPPAEDGFFGLTSPIFRTIGGRNMPGAAGYPEGIWSFHLSIGEAF